MNFPHKKITYFPFIGWLFPFIFEHKDEDSLFHTKQGMVMSIVFGGLLIFIFFLSFLLPETLRITRFSLVISIYVIYALYFTLCFMGTSDILKNRKKVFPLLGRFIDMINV